MSLIDRLYPQSKHAAAVGELLRCLPLAKKEPDRSRLRCVCDSGRPTDACDWMTWSLWQDEQNGEIWVFCSGGIANVNLCYGPGEQQIAEHLFPSER